MQSEEAKYEQEVKELEENGLSPGVSSFVESMGLLMERYGLARIGGRIMGLLMVEDQPLTLDDMSRLLNVSRASVSTNVRMSEVAGLANRVTRPGDRRDYYIGANSLATSLITGGQRDLITMRDAGRKALSLLQPHEHLARERLEEMVDFCEFFTEQMERWMQEWREYREKTYVTREGL